MTQAALEALKSSLLASAQPITAASQHRVFEQHVINELYNAVSRGQVLANVGTVLTLSPGDDVFIVRAGEVKKVARSVFAGINGGTP